ncbi:MAG: DUF1465 family protein [Hyphomicrobiaceae bacterium]
MSDLGRRSGETISFGERYMGSDRFQTLYREGMDLVEATARYLDGTGRSEGKTLQGVAAVTFATESMRLTTRLMNLASWLLIRRSVNSGEMTIERARRERLRLKLDSISRPSHIAGFEDLPAMLRDLIGQSFALEDKIVRLDRLFEEPTAVEPPPMRADPELDAVLESEPRIRLVVSSDR